MWKTILAAAAATVVLTPSAANAATAGEPLVVRKGLTFYIPGKWRIHGYGTDWVHVVTGKCAKPKDGYGTPECRGFWVLGPKAIKQGAELFNAYTGERPFYPATDVQPCPQNRKWDQVLGKLADSGLRQVGPGHKAAYREWNATCVSYDNGKVKSRFTQREWFLPKTKVLVVDQWNTPELGFIVKNAIWR